MRKVDQKDYTFGNDDYQSIFVGVCESVELLMGYMEQDYDLLDEDYIGSEFGVDFSVNFYDEDFTVYILNPEMSNDIEKIFAEAGIFDINLLKQDYPDNLDRPFNVAIVVGRLKYEGEVKEIQNDEFGYFRFLGTYPYE